MYCILVSLQAEEMIQEIKTAFKSNLPNLKWMDAETRLAAVEKVLTFRLLKVESMVYLSCRPTSTTPSFYFHLPTDPIFS